MTLSKITLVVLFALMSIGCNTTPTQYQLDNADYGPMPPLTKAKAQAESLIKSRLKDPHSAQFTWGDLEKSWFKTGGFGAKVRYAWRLNVGVNAKNSFGGYTGQKLYQYFYRGDELVGHGWQYDGYSKYQGSYATMLYMEFSGVSDWGDNDDLPKEPPALKP